MRLPRRPAHEVVAPCEHDRAEEREHAAEEAEVLRPCLACEHDARRDDEHRPDRQLELERLVEQHEREQDREERRRPDHDQRA